MLNISHYKVFHITYTIGQAVRDLGYFPPDIRIILGVPLSATSKNIYFNRQGKSPIKR